MQLLILFIICNIANVIIQTAKSLVTIKASKGIAALVNAIAYGFYTYIVILTVCDLPIWQKMLIVAGCNLIGVYVVKLVEEKSRKDKLWKIELTVPKEYTEKLHNELAYFGISHNYIYNIGKWSVFNCYAPTQKESTFIKSIANKNKAKYFVSESKTL